MYRVDELWQQHAKILSLSLVVGEDWLKKPVYAPEAHRPGLSLSGYMKGYKSNRILVFGRPEISYLRDLPSKMRLERLNHILTQTTPAVIVAKGYKPPKELIEVVSKKKIPLFRTELNSANFLTRLTFLLSDEFAPSQTCHGSLVEVFGVGVLIQGESSVGKSEAALGLVERGHRLIADDFVRVRKKAGEYIEGSGVELSKHLMEIRGIGIINVAHLYGAVCVCESKSIDIIVNLETWNDKKHYDRLGVDEHHKNILSVQVPFHLLPVKPGRDVVLLLETIALNHRLKMMGLHSAKEFEERQLLAIARKTMTRKTMTRKMTE